MFYFPKTIKGLQTMLKPKTIALFVFFYFFNQEVKRLLVWNSCSLFNVTIMNCKCITENLTDFEKPTAFIAKTVITVMEE